MKRFLLSITRFIVSGNYFRFRIWAIIILLLILVATNSLFTINGLIILLIVLSYMLIKLLNRWLEENVE